MSEPSMNLVVPPSVVLVDDTPGVRAMVKMALERRATFRVVDEAGDGQAGIESVRDHQPDVVLLDIAMPVMDGLEALPLIRAESPTSTVIMLSAFDAEALTEDAISRGADGYIQKGQSIRALLEQVVVLDSEARARRAAGGTDGGTTQGQRMPEHVQRTEQDTAEQGGSTLERSAARVLPRLRGLAHRVARAVRQLVRRPSVPAYA